ncbi:hypothetical protein PUNSTDRAFT_139754 [Punctularia strigosozonata HHB-11173 SS5]|uniref:Uncharacterized protein n=1 Tax=Punctularia strigosozonata (strain HHB-11173) TaxID=741275 RepID=R7S1W6_PUNST|nr:uncharacterized protein PUNSTDRAFT_139754 [Punctularia strigosozonata HHB-11173 SS5]EIN03226.1 hypothetical protein PUNSTDRAFT_139754 [Punctularia strigosozonata HHB-11173 SS5]
MITSSKASEKSDPRGRLRRIANDDNTCLRDLESARPAMVVRSQDTLRQPGTGPEKVEMT